jgi:hypothetical protein
MVENKKIVENTTWFARPLLKKSFSKIVLFFKQGLYLKNSAPYNDTIFEK